MIKTEFFALALRDLFEKNGKLLSNVAHIKESLKWLERAQYMGKNGGVSAWYGLFDGWHEPYIETTGYIISTFLESSHFFKKSSYLNKAIKMADFLIKNQLSNGGFKTYTDSQNQDPTIFNTGQDLIGMVDIYNATKNRKYLNSLISAADFLCDCIDSQGRWKKYSYDGRAHSYDSRVAYSLLKAYFVTGTNRYKKVAVSNLNWVIKQQLSNGWFKKAELPYPNPIIPYTHTISYTIEGLLFSGILLKESAYINSAKKAADAVLNYYLKNNFIPGTFDSKWSSSDKYSCLTGDAQLSFVWSILYKLTDDEQYLSGLEKINVFLKSKNNVTHRNNNVRGSIPGSFPIYGDLLQKSGYCRMSLINWSVKFYLDALISEEIIIRGGKLKYLGR